MKIFLNFNRTNFKLISRNSLLKYTAKYFCDEYPNIKIAGVLGVIKPSIKTSRPNNTSPKNELFYGVPFAKEIPKSSEDLIRKFEYINNYDDMISIFQNSQKHFTGVELSMFLERLFV
jgi:hypothetical protein